MLTKTNKFRVDTPNPWMEKGKIVNSTNKIECGDYPHIFSPLYRYKDTDVLLAEGDLVYRIISKKGEEIVKAVKLSEPHLEGEIELFVSSDDAEEKLRERHQNRQKRYQNQSLYYFVENIKLLSTHKGITTMTIIEIEETLDHIKNMASNALEILKSK